MKNSNAILFVCLGTAFWFVAAMIIRLLGTAVFTENNAWLILLYGLAIPLTVVFLYITSWLAKRPLRNLLGPVVIITFTATFLDAIALTWFRSLYSPSFEVALHGAAWILWGVGLGLLFSYYLHQQQAAVR